MREIAQRLHESDHTNIGWLISYAYAMRRADSIEAAKKILVHALPNFPNEAIIMYNLACYDSILGDLDSAKHYLSQVFAIESRWRLQALEDQDLKPLWDDLGDLNKGHKLESPLLDSFEK